MMHDKRLAKARTPIDSLILGYGPMAPFVVSAIGALALPPPWPGVSTTLAVIWGALILAFVGGVRRGFGFGAPASSKVSAIVASIVYFVPAGLALIALAEQMISTALMILAVGFYLVIILDRDAARKGNAPRYFEHLRLSQMLIAIASLLILLVLHRR